MSSVFWLCLVMRDIFCLHKVSFEAFKAICSFIVFMESSPVKNRFADVLPLMLQVGHILRRTWGGEENVGEGGRRTWGGRGGEENVGGGGGEENLGEGEERRTWGEGRRMWGRGGEESTSQ